jgi:hypothetical protein
MHFALFLFYMKKLNNRYSKQMQMRLFFVCAKVENCRCNKEGLLIHLLEYITEWREIGVMENGRNDTSIPFCYQETRSRS